MIDLLSKIYVDLNELVIRKVPASCSVVKRVKSGALASAPFLLFSCL